MTIPAEACEYCEYCEDVIEEPGLDGACERCWYGMRLSPFAWQNSLYREGKLVLYIGGCVVGPVTIPADPKRGLPERVAAQAISCRNGYRRLKSPTLAQRWRAWVDAMRFRWIGDPLEGL